MFNLTVAFVITDGVPYTRKPRPLHHASYAPIIERYVSRAMRAGIEIVGVGVGFEAQYVREVFPSFVWAESFEELPKKLIDALQRRAVVQTSRS